MCGIVGFLAKKPEFVQSLGEHVVPMLTCMGDRGPDSAGLAVFGEPVDPSLRRFSLYVPDRRFDWSTFEQQLASRIGGQIELSALENHAVLISSVEPVRLKAWLTETHPGAALAFDRSSHRRLQRRRSSDGHRSAIPLHSVPRDSCRRTHANGDGIGRVARARSPLHGGRGFLLGPQRLAVESV